MLNDIFLHHKWLNLRISKFTQTETTLDFGEDTKKDYKISEISTWTQVGLARWPKLELSPSY